MTKTLFTVMAFMVLQLSFALPNPEFVRHKVARGETLYAIAKRYGLTLAELKKSNPSLRGNNVQAGQSLRVPAGEKQQTITQTPVYVPVQKVNATSPPLRSEVEQPKANTISAESSAPRSTEPTEKSIYGYHYHKVRKGETFYALCKEYGASTTQVKQWNRLTNYNIQVGQQLIVGVAYDNEPTALSAPRQHKDLVYMEEQPTEQPLAEIKKDDLRATQDEVAMPAGMLSPMEMSKATASISDQTIDEDPTLALEVSPEKKVYNITSAAKPADYPKLFEQFTNEGMTQTSQRGAAAFITENSSGNPYLALYSGAASGSIIKVTNLMNKKAVHLKVVGRVPATDSAQEIILKVSNHCAQELGTTDYKFLVEVASLQAE